MKVALIAAIQFIILMILFPLIYDTNDDFWMNAIASGAYSGSPSEFLVFTNIVIGKILKVFYSILPDYNWYSLYMLSSLFLGYVAIQFSFYKLKANYTIRIIRHILIFTVLFFTLTQSGFTRTAAIVAAGGFLMVFTYNKKSYFILCVGIFLTVLSFLIRPAVFYMYLLLFMPFIFVLVLKKKYLKLLYFTAAFLLVFFSNIYNSAVMEANDEYAKYRAFNSIRASLLNSHNPNMNKDNVEPLLGEVGWTDIDFSVAKRGTLDIGHGKFSENKLKNLKSLANGEFGEKLQSSAMISGFKDTLRYLWNYYDERYFSLTLILISGILFFSRRPSIFLSVIAFALYTVFIAFFLYYFRDGMLKPRVLFGMTLPLVLYVLYNIDDLGRIPQKPLFLENVKRNNIGLLMINLSLISLVITAFNYKEKSAKIYRQRDLTHKIFEYIKDQNLEFYVSRFRGSPYYIYKNPPSLTSGYRLGWFTGSPYNKEKIEKYTGDKELGVYTIFNQDIIWYFNRTSVRRDKSHVVNLYRKYYPGCRVRGQRIKLSGRTKLYKLTFHIPKLDISPLSTLGVGMRFGEQYRISKLAAKGLSLSYRPEIPEELQIPEEIEADDEE